MFLFFIKLKIDLLFICLKKTKIFRTSIISVFYSILSLKIIFMYENKFINFYIKFSSEVREENLSIQFVKSNKSLKILN